MLLAARLTRTSWWGYLSLFLLCHFYLNSDHTQGTGTEELEPLDSHGKQPTATTRLAGIEEKIISCLPRFILLDHFSFLHLARPPYQLDISVPSPCSICLRVDKDALSRTLSARSSPRTPFKYIFPPSTFTNSRRLPFWVRQHNTHHRICHTDHDVYNASELRVARTSTRPSVTRRSQFDIRTYTNERRGRERTEGHSLGGRRC